MFLRACLSVSLRSGQHVSLYMNPHQRWQLKTPLTLPWTGFAVFVFCSTLNSFIHSFIWWTGGGATLGTVTLNIPFLPIPALYSFQSSSQVPICIAPGLPVISGLPPLHPHSTSAVSQNLALHDACDVGFLGNVMCAICLSLVKQ